MDSTNMEASVRSRSPSPSPSSVPAAAPTPPHTEREFWTNACISVLLDEYEKVFARSGRGHVKSKDWELIASQVNLHKDSNHRTPEQCKTKIEGLKKYYRKERLKSIACPSDSSRWLFFDKLSHVVGDAPPSTPHLHPHPHPHPSTPQVATPPPPYYATSKSLDGGRLAIVNRAPLDNNGGGASKKAPVKTQNGSTSDINVLDRIDFRRRLFERMGLDRAEYQARMIDGFEDILVDSKVSDRQGYAKESSVWLKEEIPKQIEPKNSPAEAEMGGNPRKARPGGKPAVVRKKRDYSSSLGKDIKDALSSFAAVIEKIEKTKMHMATTLQKQRLEQDQHHAEMEVERTRMIMKNQLELAKLICADRKRDGNQDEEDDDELEMAKKSRWDSGVEGLVKEGSEETSGRHVENAGKMGLRMDSEEFRSHNEGGVEKLDEYQEDQVNLQGGLFGSKDGEMAIGNQAYRGNGTLDGGPSYRVSGELDGSESFREDVASHTGHMTRANGHEVTDWANGMGMLWRGGCHDLNRTINTHTMMEVGQGENRMEIVEDDERIAH